MMLPFGCNSSQPILNILADIMFCFEKMVKSNFGPITKISGPFKKIVYFSLTARSQQKRTILVSIPTYFCPNFSFFAFLRRFKQQGCQKLRFFVFLKKIGFITILESFFEKIMSKPKPIYTSENIAVL